MKSAITALDHGSSGSAWFTAIPCPANCLSSARGSAGAPGNQRRRSVRWSAMPAAGRRCRPAEGG
jgi:hypothetical protein